MHQIRFTTLSRVSMPQNIYCDFDLICNYALAMQRKQLLSYSWLYKLHTCGSPKNNEQVFMATSSSSYGSQSRDIKRRRGGIFAWNGKGNGNTFFDIWNIFFLHEIIMQIWIDMGLNNQDFFLLILFFLSSRILWWWYCVVKRHSKPNANFILS